MITEGQVAGNPKEAAELIAVLTKENDRLRAACQAVVDARTKFQIQNAEQQCAAALLGLPEPR